MDLRQRLNNVRLKAETYCKKVKFSDKLTIEFEGETLRQPEDKHRDYVSFKLLIEKDAVGNPPFMQKRAYFCYRKLHGGLEENLV